MTAARLQRAWRDGSGASRTSVLALGWTAVLYAACLAVLRASLGVTPTRWYWADFALLAAMSQVLFLGIRPAWRAAIAEAGLVATVYVAPVVKISTWGAPILPQDISAGPALLSILSELHPVWTALGVAVGTIAVLAAVVPRRRDLRRVAVLAILALAATSVVRWRGREWLRTLDGTLGNVSWDQTANFENRGGALYLAQEGIRYAVSQRRAPSAAEVDAALRELEPAGAPRPHDVSDAAPRNVYVVLVESLWDGKELVAAGKVGRVLAPELERLWSEGGRSVGVSPVLGGVTSNSEFELLCGVPAPALQGVVFEDALRNDLPCLPRAFAERGYRTVAAHPDRATFWNRNHAYRFVGFEQYLDVKDYVLDDLNETFLSDESFLRQSLRRMRADSDGRPLFAYLLTISLHWPYPLDETRRPPVSGATSKVPEVVHYASAAYHSSAEVARFVEVLRQEDPDALIVVVGDHSPFLGSGFAGYVEAGLLPGSGFSGAKPEAMLRLYSVPLVFVDGRRGVQDLGRVPMYSLATMIAQRANVSLAPALALWGTPPWTTWRPLEGRVLMWGRDQAPRVCASPWERDCSTIGARYEEARTVAGDLAYGRQYALRPRLASGAGVDVSSDVSAR